MDYSTNTCDKVRQSNDEETKAIPKYFSEKKAFCKVKFPRFTCIFINYYRYLLVLTVIS